MINPYRITSDSNNVQFKLVAKFIIFEYDKNHTCPCCKNKNYNNFGLLAELFMGCLGKSKFFGLIQLCPKVPHMHLKCKTCKFYYLMHAAPHSIFFDEILE